jgi:hypothetical protein
MKNVKDMSAAEREMLRMTVQLLLSSETRAGMNGRDWVLREAERGDCAPLAEYIRDGGRVTPAMRPHLIAALKKKRPGKKVALASTRERDYELVSFVLNARRRREGGVLKKAEEKFGRTLRHIKKILAKHKGGEAEIRADLTRLLEEIVLDARHIYEACGSPEVGVPKYRVWRDALIPYTFP